MIERARLEAALAWAEARYHDCDVCAARCRVDRHAGELGLCRLGVAGRVYKEYLHLGEERCLVPSHTVFLAGCNLRCVFCSDLGPVENPQRHGMPLSPAGLAARVALRRSQGARNVHFVGGLPDVNVLYVLRTLAHCPADTHVVWNTNLWTTEEAIRRLTGVVGTWLVDYKFGADRCARELARVQGYTERLQRLLPIAAAAGPTIVRHLLMPGHLACCTQPVLEWLARQLPDASVNLMTAYHPFHLAGSPGPLGGPVPAAERAAAIAHLAALPFRGGRLLDGVEYPCAP